MDFTEENWRDAVKDRQISDACFRVYALVQTLPRDDEGWPTWPDLLAAAESVIIDDLELMRHLRLLVTRGYIGQLPDEYHSELAQEQIDQGRRP